MVLKKFLLTAAIFGTSLAQAAPLFTDDFDSDPLGLDAIAFSGGWSVSGGTVDVIGPGFFNLLPGNGRYIDLDGTTGKAGIFANSLDVTSGMTYTLSFDLAGNHRGAGDDTVVVNFGTGSQTFTRAATDGFQTYMLNYTATGTGKVGFSFIDQGNDSEGALLDRVSVTAVPEPETYGMLLGGLALLGVVARRRRQL